MKLYVLIDRFVALVGSIWLGWLMITHHVAKARMLEEVAPKGVAAPWIGFVANRDKRASFDDVVPFIKGRVEESS